MDKKRYQAPQTKVEKAFVEVWQKLLEKEKIGIYDNFFELGGHSFLAVQVVNRMNLLGYQVKLKDIFLHQNIAELAQKANSLSSDPAAAGEESYNSSGNEDNCIIPIQKKGDLTPVFVVHSVWIYIQLASYLGNNQPLYCLDEAKFERVEDMASLYITKMKSIQPKGPYYIGGFCRFGYIALEIARQLVGQGEEVGALFLFETYSPAGVISRLSLKYLKLSYYKFMHWPLLNRKRYLKDELRQAAKKVLCGFTYLVTKRYLVKTFSGKITLLKPVPYGFAYSGKVILFKAGTPEIWAKDDKEMGWSRFFSGEIESHIIEGNHTEMFKEPGVLKLSKVMKRILQNSKNQVATYS